MKKVLSAILVALLALSLFAGGSQEAASSAKEEKVKLGTIASVYGTASFNDDILDGIKLACEKYGLEESHIEVPDVADVENALRTLIQDGCNFIIIGSADHKDGMIATAENYPNVKFLYLGDKLEGYDNIVGTEYAEQQGAFLCGALAALLSETHNVGAVAAVQGDTVQERYAWGFSAGAKYAVNGTTVQRGFTNSYADVNKGNEFATAMYNKGADIVSCFAGACNLGVFNAAVSLNKLCFGAAKGQFDKAPDNIIASLVKPVDQTVLAVISDYIDNGNFDTSTSMILGVANDGVICKYTTMNDTLRAKITPEIEAKIEELKADIISGKIVPPSSETEYNAFVAQYGLN